jgi:hypothetical protein
MECENCQTILIGDYCHSCGQKSNAARICFGELLNSASRLLPFSLSFCFAERG